MAFEKFAPLFFTFYLLLSLSIAIVLSLLHWGIGVGVILLALLAFTRVLKGAGFLKRTLIRKGDRVEYVDPNEKDEKKIFKKAEVVLKMHPHEVEKTKLISSELMEDNQHFYLVKEGKDVRVIAYDWIIGLSPELLEIEFAHDEL